ncbi:MAG: peptidoglycan-binding protein [Candidatus Odyssella sp.]|nr:peptidoglycan-binding protein [Candidatus Odyssella sp.]
MYDFDELQLNRPLSATSDADPQDVLSAKSAFKRLGYYETPSYGLTPYPDQQLFDGVRAYQKDKGLAVDGYMLPAGETEQSVNKSLASDKMDRENDEDQGCAEPAIQPWQIPSLGLPRPRGYCPLPREKTNEADCERQAQDDERFCGSISGPRAAYRRQRCWASVQARYGHCKHTGQLGYPRLDTGEW